MKAFFKLVALLMFLFFKLVLQQFWVQKILMWFNVAFVCKFVYYKSAEINKCMFKLFGDLKRWEIVCLPVFNE
jgi:hypothetical protein